MKRNYVRVSLEAVYIRFFQSSADVVDVDTLVVVPTMQLGLKSASSFWM
jgi:hypothetical protein